MSQNNKKFCWTLCSTTTQELPFRYLMLCSALAVTFKDGNCIGNEYCSYGGFDLFKCRCFSHPSIHPCRYSYHRTGPTIILPLVIVTDQILKAFLFDISKQLSVFVGLIITNCIVMGRAGALRCKMVYGIQPMTVLVMDWDTLWYLFL